MQRPYRVVDLTGKRFGKYFVESMSSFRDARNIIHWNCICDCGNKRIVQGANLKSGKSHSCGCERNSDLSKRMTTHGASRGEVKIKSGYKCWDSMKQRCLNPNHVAYHRYGGRGIVVCDRWVNSFESFLSDMGPRPTPEHSIERVDNDGNYEPSNCVWKIQRSENLSTNRKITSGGKTLTLSEWSRELSVPISTIFNRLRRGWSQERAVSK